MTDETFMRFALEVAEHGVGRTRPNPAVGCVIVKDGEVIATGFHRKAGTDHAEVDALDKVEDTSGAVMYVTLEPCCTHGRTPPCTDAILATGISRVVVGTRDTNPNVAGLGLKKLADHGIELTVGVLEEECRRLNHGYFSVVERGRPWIAAKYGMSLDGKIATLGGESKWITNEASRARVAQLRNRFDAVCVGTETLVRDDPRLTARVEGGRDPARILIDRQLRTPLAHRALDGAVQTILFISPDCDVEKRNQLAARGIDVIEQPFEDGLLGLKDAFKTLVAFDIGTVIVEGGGALLGSLAEERLIDEVFAFIAPKIFGGAGREPFVSAGPESMAHVAHLTDIETEVLEDNVLVHGFWKH